MSILFFLGCLASLVTSVLLYGLATYVARRESSTALLLLLNGATVVYLFFYLWGVLMDLQRADLIDFRKMLLLPVSLPLIYMLNFGVSIVSPIMLFAFPGLICLLAGLYPAFGVSAFFVGIPLALLFMLMMSAWAYYFRGRLAIFMENKRRRRIVLVLLPLSFVALGQLPAVISHLALIGGDNEIPRNAVEQLLPLLLLVNAAAPVFWPAYGLWAFLQHASLTSVFLAGLGLFLCTVLGLRFGYVSTLRHYMGLNSHVASAPIHTVSRGQRTPVTARRLPLLSDDTAALTLAFYYSFARHPHVRMLIIMPLCLGLFFLFMYRTGAYGEFKGGEGSWIPMATLVWPYFNFSLFMFNVFGVDAASLHGLLLLPAPRYKYLAAKNLALAPFVLGLALFFIAAGALLVGASVRVIVLSLALALHLYLFFSVVGNFLSIRFPYRINRDALRLPTRRLRMLVVGVASTLLVAVMVVPASLCMFADRAYTLHHQPAVRFSGLIAAAGLLTVSLVLYLYSLFHTGDQFTAREQILYERLHGDVE